MKKKILGALCCVAVIGLIGLGIMSQAKAQDGGATSSKEEAPTATPEPAPKSESRPNSGGMRTEVAPPQPGEAHQMQGSQQTVAPPSAPDAQHEMKGTEAPALPGAEDAHRMQVVEHDDQVPHDLAGGENGTDSTRLEVEEQDDQAPLALDTPEGDRLEVTETDEQDPSMPAAPNGMKGSQVVVSGEVTPTEDEIIPVDAETQASRVRGFRPSRETVTVHTSGGYRTRLPANHPHVLSRARHAPRVQMGYHPENDNK